MNREKCLEFLKPHLELLIDRNNIAIENCVTIDTRLYFMECLKTVMEVQEYLEENLK
jgi:hypothetical protein